MSTRYRNEVCADDVIVWLVNLAEQGYVPMWLRDTFEREFVPRRAVTCSCTVKPPDRKSACGGAWGWALHVDEFRDSTRFDPQCPYHGDDGSMVSAGPSDA